MGSGQVGRSYFTEENGRLFQLPLTWYRERGWDFSPGYQNNNGRFDRLLPDRCIACHSSYPAALPYLEGKYAELHSGIGCERCHGPGALHVAERRASAKLDSGYDRSIVNPARLPVQRRMDVCEQCHVHTTVAVLREGKHPFGFLPSQSLRDQWAFFRVSGTIDIVSHADRLRQSKCFIATQKTAWPLECATCHNPHEPPADQRTRSQSCLSCHAPPALRQKLARSASLAAHTPSSDCVSSTCPGSRSARSTVRSRSTGSAWRQQVQRVRRRPGTPGGPSNPTTIATASALRPRFTRGWARSSTRPWQATYRAAVEEEPSLAAAWFNLGTLLIGEGRPAEAAKALGRAVKLDPRMADALSPLIEFRATGTTIGAVKNLVGSLPALRGGDRLTRAVLATATPAGSAPAVEFTGANVITRVDIMQPDGTLLRSISGATMPMRWDLKNEKGAPVAGGLYRALIVGREPSGRSRTTQMFVGLVRARGRTVRLSDVELRDE